MRLVVLILGASIRAAATSAQRAGFAVCGGDLFADADLADRCQVHRAESYPADLLKIARQYGKDIPWLYTGALENYPRLIEQITADRPLYGNPAAVLHQVRDPWQLSTVLATAGLPYPQTARTAAGLPRDGSWLVKRRRGSGGAHVHPLTEAWSSSDETSPAAVYFQERIQGLARSAVYVANDSDAELLGVTEQILGAPWCGSRGFQYAGSLGPLVPDQHLQQQLRQLGGCLAKELGLRGLFGVDFVLANETVWPIEVNPRYTASVEILERAGGLLAMQHHVAACREGRLPAPVVQPGDRVFGKAILFARETVCISGEQSDQCLEAARLPCPEVADVPVAGTIIQPGRPVLTVFAHGTGRAQALEQLQQQMARWRQILQA